MDRFNYTVVETPLRLRMLGWWKWSVLNNDGACISDTPTLGDALRLVSRWTYLEGEWTNPTFGYLAPAERAR